MIDLIWGDHLIVVASPSQAQDRFREAIQRLWIYAGHKGKGGIVTATPLAATGLRARTNINGLWIYG